MKEKRKPKGYWTKEKCHKEALKYQHRKDFKFGSNTVYTIALNNKWMDEICSHMKRLVKPNGYWTKERCHQEALKYQHRNDFNKGSKSAYYKASTNGWLDDICSHMTPQGSKELRYIYTAVFPNDFIYVGLTYDFKTRKREHITDKDSAVYQYMIETNTIPKIKLFDGILYPKNVASKLEEELRIIFKEDGFNILNRRKCGGLGSGKIYWTKKRCHEEALKYNTRSEFNKGSSSAYQQAVKKGWINDITTHMIYLCKPNGYWTKERCYEEALKYNTKLEFKIASPTAYSKASKRGWINEFCSHMIPQVRPNGTWTKEKCQEEALKYNTRSEFQKNCGSAYNASLRCGWRDEICSHMNHIQHHNGYWTLDRCQAEALKYNTRMEFKKGSSTPYRILASNKMLDNFFF